MIQTHSQKRAAEILKIPNKKEGPVKPIYAHATYPVIMDREQEIIINDVFPPVYNRPIADTVGFLPQRFKTFFRYEL